MLKILLVSSNFENISLATSSDHQPEGVITEETNHYPLGIAYLHSYLERSGYEVAVLYLNNQTDETCLEAVKDKIKTFQPDVVGFQIFTSNRTSSYRLFEYTHENYPEIKLVIGGIHSTIMYRQLLENFPFLIAVLGEGEITFTELLDELAKNEPDLTKIKGIAHNQRGEIIVTAPRELISNLDSLPFPKHEPYFENKKRTSACLLTSRGCAFACSFCCLESISRRRVRLRSAKNVVDEIEYLLNNIPQIKKIWIHDDNFLIDNNRVMKICDEIIRRKIKTNFTCSARMKPISLEMLKKMEQAGFTRVLLGLESGDNDILKSCHKGIVPEDAVNAVKLIAQTNLTLNIFLIVGLPGETDKTILNTAKLIKRLQKIKYFPIVDTSILTVYPGTEVYEISKGANTLSDAFWLSEKPVPLYTTEHSPRELLRFKRILLNHISVLNFLTPGGFVSQLSMIPSIINYAAKHKNIIRDMASRTIKLYLPANLYIKIKKRRHVES
ncbi:MAG: radical SAM protein [Candidatus Falkowbacteria bacterium]